MCLLHLMIFVSTFPFSVAMSGMHKPHDALRVPSMNNLADETAVVYGGVPLPNRVRGNHSRLTVLSSLLISLVVAFVVVRCFIALKSRTYEHEYAINSRRLALENDGDCAVSIRTVDPVACFLCGGRLRKAFRYH